MGLRISKSCIALIKKFEGCHLTAYQDTAGVWTIGYGHTSGVTSGQTITQAQAEGYLISDLAVFEAHVGGYNSKYAWTQNEFDALVSFAYNVGSINQLTAARARSKATIADCILLYNKSAGKVLTGLTKRRQAEQDLFLTESTVRTLKYKSSGMDVTYLQQRLAAKGYSIGTIDGKFGVKTLEAVKAFQVASDLTVDGIVGVKTWAALAGG